MKGSGKGWVILEDWGWQVRGEGSGELGAAEGGGRAAHVASRAPPCAQAAPARSRCSALPPVRQVAFSLPDAIRPPQTACPQLFGPGRLCCYCPLESVPGNWGALGAPQETGAEP